MLVKDFIYKDITSISEITPIRQLIRVMTLNRISCLPVVNEYNEYLGGICDSSIIEASIPDYMKALNNTSFLPDIGKITDNMKNILDKQVKEFLVEDYPTVKPEDSISYAADLMDKSGKTVLHVVEGNQFIGYINKFDLLSMALSDSD